MRVTLANGVLYSQIGTHDKQELVPVSEQQFRRRGEPTATCAFVEDVDGTVVLRGGRELEKAGYRTSRVGVAGCGRCSLTQ